VSLTPTPISVPRDSLRCWNASSSESSPVKIVFWLATSTEARNVGLTGFSRMAISLTRGKTFLICSSKAGFSTGTKPWLNTSTGVPSRLVHAQSIQDLNNSLMITSSSNMEGWDGLPRLCFWVNGSATHEVNIFLLPTPELGPCLKHPGRTLS